MGDQGRAELDAARRWVEDWLLGDVRTFLLGTGTVRREGIETYEGAALGAGNLSVPILLSTASELLAALYCGTTKYGSGGYDAARNVVSFVTRYWPQPYHAIAALLWDGMRNGLTHTFAAKWFRSGGTEVDMQFSVEAESVVQWRGANHVALVLSIGELYTVVRDAAAAYFADLGSDADLHARFRQAFGELVTYRRDVSGDRAMSGGVEWLLRQCPPGAEMAMATGANRPLPTPARLLASSPVTGSTQNYGVRTAALPHQCGGQVGDGRAEPAGGDPRLSGIPGQRCSGAAGIGHRPL